MAASSVDGHSLTEVMTQLAPDARLLASAAALTLASEAIVGARLLGTHGDARMAFTNVRLVPCLVKASIGNQVAAFTGSRVPGERRAARAVPGRCRRTAARVTGPPRDDAARTACAASSRASRPRCARGSIRRPGAATGEVTDGFNDTRLMVQIGMALGVVYVAFLSVWFWATRVRGLGSRA